MKMKNRVWSWRIVRAGFLASAILFFLHNTSLAIPLQIIHTNDLHSHLDHTEDPRVGGFAAVKATIDRLKAEAQALGIETIVVDAGDFSEGSRFHFADRGYHVWRTMNAMGYDAVTIGNHDWLQGPADLDWVVGQTKPSFAFLGANFYVNPALRPSLAYYLQPSVELTRAGSRIAVLGLTTPEQLFSWRAKEAAIGSHFSEAAKRIPDLRTRNDFVIALTHLGTSEDRALASSVAGIDLVIGGHSHTPLETPLYARYQKTNKYIPIVQADHQGRRIGDLLLDIEPGKPLRVLRYRLIPVSAEGAKDPTIAGLVNEAQAALEKQYGATWLKEVIGHTDVPLRGATLGDQTKWSKFVADAIRDAAKTSVGLDIPSFTGLGMPAGPITRQDVMELFPRIFNFDHGMGWTVWVTYIRGYVLKALLRSGVQLEFPYTLSMSGVSFDRVHVNGVADVDNVKVNGEALGLTGWYSVAIPEGIGRGSKEVPTRIGGYLAGTKDTQIPIWTAIENRLRRVGRIR